MLSKYKNIIVKKYSNCIETDPIKTKVLTSSLFYIIGDSIAQKAVLKKEVIDQKQLGYGTFATAVCTIVTHKYQGYMQAFINSGKLITTSSSNLKKALTTLTLDQTFFSPFINSMFLISVAVMMERNIGVAQEKWCEKFESTQKASYMMWPIAQFANFYFIPIQFRILFMNTIGMFWTSIRTKINQPPTPQKKNKSHRKGKNQLYREKQKQKLEKQKTLYYYYLPLAMAQMTLTCNKINNNFSGYSDYFRNHVHLMQGVQY